MKNNSAFIFSAFVILMSFSACRQKDNKGNVIDTYNQGSVSFVADESLATILDQELYVFKALNKEAKPNIIYKSENDALRLFLNDSIRVAFIARNLTAQEIDRFRQTKKLYPEINLFAYDAVTMIVNQASADTLISVAEIKQMLNGKIKTDKNIVFDNANSSLIRYLRSFSGNNQMNQKNIYALKTNIDVIKYVSENPHAVGFISYSWLLEPDKSYAPMVDKIKIVGVKDEGNKDDPKRYFKPDQTTLVQGGYPLVRPLYIINNTGRPGLGTGVASFIMSERGQRIVLRSGLMPDSIPTREVSFGK